MRPRRAIRTALVFVLLGAVATVLTSWAIHALVAWRGSTWIDGKATFSGNAWLRPESLEWPRDRVRTEYAEIAPIADIDSAFFGSEWSLGWTSRRRWVCVGRGEPGGLVYSNDHLSITTMGLPWHAMRVVSFQTSPSSNPADRTTSPSLSPRHGIQLVDGSPNSDYIVDRFALPLLPLWPGFLINTFFYALLLFIAWRLPGVLRRAVRRRGRCVGCGYSRDGLDGGAACPECGAGVRLIGARRVTTEPSQKAAYHGSP